MNSDNHTMKCNSNVYYTGLHGEVEGEVRYRVGLPYLARHGNLPETEWLAYI